MNNTTDGAILHQDIDIDIQRARKAMAQIDDASQERIDEIVKALAWAIYRDDHARILAEMSVEDTGLGNVPDKIVKNKRKTFGTLCDLMATRTRGLCRSEPERGLYTYFKPVGVVGSLTPSTNPAATPANQALMAIKGGNSIVVSPSPAGARTARKLKEFFDQALQAIDAPPDLFQVVDSPISFDRAAYLLQQVDLVLVTGDQANVRRGYQSGKPCIGVGKGNVPVIIDSSADLSAAAKKIRASKTFDNATSCSSENSIIIVDDAYDEMLHLLTTEGGYLADSTECEHISSVLFENGSLNRKAVGRAMNQLDDLFNLGGRVRDKAFIMVELSDYGDQTRLSGEKISLVLALYRARDTEHAMEICNGILNYEGIGHSVGIHSQNDEVVHELARKVKVARVLVNQAHTFGTGGGMDNALPFTLSMGCGTWAGNSISDNLNIMNFVNKTTLVKTFNKTVPEKAHLFGDFYNQSLDSSI